jgi:hypothetical protein
MIMGSVLTTGVLLYGMADAWYFGKDFEPFPNVKIPIRSTQAMPA